MKKTDEIIKIDNVSVQFGNLKALNNVSNHINRGEVVVVIGPSGSGKSTLLRTLNGLQSFQSGKVIIDGVDISEKKTDMNGLRSEVGMVFQHFNLFQHKTALQNITLPQRIVLKRSNAEAEKVANELLEQVGIPEKANMYPNQLSGGFMVKTTDKLQPFYLH